MKTCLLALTLKCLTTQNALLRCLLAVPFVTSSFLKVKTPELPRVRNRTESKVRVCKVLPVLKQLKRAGVATKELITLLHASAPLWSMLCPVFHNSLPSYLSDDELE